MYKPKPAASPKAKAKAKPLEVREAVPKGLQTQKEKKTLHVIHMPARHLHPQAAAQIPSKEYPRRNNLDNYAFIKILDH